MAALRLPGMPPGLALRSWPAMRAKAAACSAAALLCVGALSAVQDANAGAASAGRFLFGPMRTYTRGVFNGVHLYQGCFSCLG